MREFLRGIERICTFVLIIWGSWGLTGKVSAQQTGFIIFESNRTGNFELYRVGLDGREEQPLTDNGADNQWASISPDGARVLWTKREGSRVGLYSISVNGDDERLEVDGAILGSYLADGRILFTKNRSDGTPAQWVSTGRESKPVEVFCPAEKKLQATNPEQFFAGITLDPFIFWSPNPRGTSIVRRNGAGQRHVHKGCMPRFMPDGLHFIWVRDAGTFGISRVGAGSPYATLYKVDRKQEYNHGYFPYVSPDYQWLVFAACPHNQHNHDTANYQIFLQRINKGLYVEPPRRITSTEANDRRPVLWTPEAGEFQTKLAKAHNEGRLETILRSVVVPGFGAGGTAAGKDSIYGLRFDFGDPGSEEQSAFESLGSKVEISARGLSLKSGNGLVYKERFDSAIEALKASREFSLIMDVWVPDREPNREGTVFQIRTEQGSENLALMQKGARCLVAFKDSEKPLNHGEPQLNGKMPDAGYNHIALTYNDGALRLFINGKVADTAKVGKVPKHWGGNTTLVLGGKLGFWSAPWTGTIRNFEFVNKKMGESDIQELYKAAKKGRPQG